MKRLIIGILLFVASAMALPSQGHAEYTGVITVDSVAGVAGDIVAVSVTLNNNNLDFASIYIPLQYDNSKLAVNSVTFENSLVASSSRLFGSVYQDPSNGLIRITYLPDFDPDSSIGVIVATDGLIATINFKILDNTPLGFTNIDSINLRIPVSDSQYVEEKVYIIDNSGFEGSTFYPDFVPGQVKIVLTTGIEDDIKNGLPLTFALDQNYPNPFNPSTTIDYAVSKAGHVNLQIFNILGQEVVTLVNEYQSSGVYKVQFNGRNHPSGIYFYRLSSEEGSFTRKMVMIK